MLELQEIVRQLTERGSVVIQGNAYKVDNVVYISDVETLKTRLLLKSTSSENKIVIDVDIFAKIYKCQISADKKGQFNSMDWCLEDEMQALLDEEGYLDNIISQLSELKYRKGYEEFLKDVTKLLDELKDKKETIQKNIQGVTDDLVMIAEACAGEYHRSDGYIDPYIREY